MKFYSSTEEQINQETELEKPAPYNWLAILIVFLVYLVFALIN
jgi:hypothetical protein